MSPSCLLPLSTLTGDTQLSPALASELARLEDDFNVPLDKVFEQFMWEFNEGLNKVVTPENRDTFLPMIPTYVQNVPTGKEKGTFLALDLGGTNLRVCEVTLTGDHKFSMIQEKYKVSEELKKAHATELFDYIAKSVGQFLDTKSESNKASGQETEDDDEKLWLGFTFSFPVLQTAIAKGTLINWTKGFECPGAAGEDVVQLLQSALDRAKIPVRCAALVNDTCGTLMARAYESGSCLCGGIFGTGTNGAYVEKLSNLGKMDKDFVQESEKKGAGDMVVNTEWGAFDNERTVLPFTVFDSRVDRISINPRKQAFEKMVSGMYLGEVTRNVILHLVDTNLLFDGHSSAQLNAHYGLDTAIMSALEAPFSGSQTASSQSHASISSVLTSQLGLPPHRVTPESSIACARISEIVGTRACRLAAAAIAAVVRQTGFEKDPKKGKAAFGLDGSLVQFYPRFEERVRSALGELVGEEVEERVEIGLAKDGSGVGAALCAQSAKVLASKGLQ